MLLSFILFIYLFFIFFISVYFILFLEILLSTKLNFRPALFFPLVEDGKAVLNHECDKLVRLGHCVHVHVVRVRRARAEDGGRHDDGEVVGAHLVLLGVLGARQQEGEHGPREVPVDDGELVDDGLDLRAEVVDLHGVHPVQVLAAVLDDVPRHPQRHELLVPLGREDGLRKLDEETLEEMGDVVCAHRREINICLNWRICYVNWDYICE